MFGSLIAVAERGGQQQRLRVHVTPAARSSRRTARTDNGCRSAPGSPRDGTARRTPAGRCTPSPSFEPSNSDTCVTLAVGGSVSGSTAKPWFWLVISTLPGGEVLHRLVGAAMAALQLVGLRAQRQRQQLVAEADAEHRHAGLQHAADRRHRVFAGRRRIARAVGQEHAVRLRGAGCHRPSPSPAPRSRGIRPRPGSAGCCASPRNPPRPRGASARSAGPMPAGHAHRVSSHS